MNFIYVYDKIKVTANKNYEGHKLPPSYIPVIILFIMFRNRRKVAIMREIIKRKSGDNSDRKALTRK